MNIFWGFILAVIFVVPASGQSAVLLRNTDGHIMQCDSTHVLEAGPRTDFSVAEKDTIFVVHKLWVEPKGNFFDSDDDENEENALVNIGCIRYTGERVQWFYQLSDGKFILADRQPLQTDASAKFQFVTTEQDSDEATFGFTTTAYIRSPDGKSLGSFDLQSQGQARKMIAYIKERDAAANSHPVPASSAPLPTSQAPPSSTGPVKTRWGVSITFKSCGYRAVGLSVSCTNSQTGKTATEILAVTDTTPEACVSRLGKACSAVGYGGAIKGPNIEIVGTGIVVNAVGPIFDKKDF